MDGETVLLSFADFGCIEDLALGVRWGPADLASQVQNRVPALVAAGIAPGSTVLVAHSGSARFLADLFAIWSVGATAACIDAGLTSPEIETLADFVEPSAVLIDQVAPAARIGAPVLQLAGSPASEGVAGPVDAPDRPALLLFTSGTTGNPKGVVLSFRALQNRIALNKAAIGSASRLRTLVTLPTSFGHGLLGNTLTPLLSGGDVVLHPAGLALAQNLGRLIDRHRIGFLSSVPSFWRMALKFSRAPVGGTLTRVHVGSAPLSNELWNAIADWSRAEVVNCYGITELANWVAGASSWTDGIDEGLVGKPWGGEAAVKDESGAMQTVGEGELLIRSPSAMSGYLHRPDLTAAVLVDGWFHTGDTGIVDERGRIWLTGRIKDEINRAGLKVQPAELDALLEAHPAVAEAIVFGMPDEVSGEIVAAAVCLAPGRQATAEALRQWCAERLRRDAVPQKWFMVESLPRNARGKINRDWIRKWLVGDSP